MPLKTPKFWYRGPNTATPLQEYLLSPVAGLYQCAHKINQSRKTPYKAALPVICIGGAVAGGSGKTPVCASVMRLVMNHRLAKSPAFLMRGYGGSLDLAFVEDAQSYSADEVGDEALLLVEIAPVIVAKDRVAGAKLAAEVGVDLLIMDDGLQNNTLVKDLTLLVIDGSVGFGNGKTLPAGPLREPVSAALEKADAVVLIGTDKRDVQHIFVSDMNCLQAFSESICEVEGKNVLAFAGIGRPEKFFEALSGLGAELVATHSYADHHVYLDSEIKALRDKAQKLDAVLVTTKKDMTRLKSSGLDEGVIAADQVLRWVDEAALLGLLKGVLA